LGALPSSTSNIQPIFALLGLALDSAYVADITRDYLEVKRRFFPGLHQAAHNLDGIKVEIKGSEIRKNIANGNRSSRRAAFGFLDKIFELVNKYDGCAFGRLYIKGIGSNFNGRSVYTSSMQNICHVFQYLLESKDDNGIIIADSRNKSANVIVSHSIFTRKYQVGGDSLANLVEMPVFGHDDNHAGLQIVDLLVSAILFPIAIQTYCLGHINSVHVRNYSHLKDRYKLNLKNLQFRYQDTNSRMRGGITVSDAISGKHGGYLFI